MNKYTVRFTNGDIQKVTAASVVDDITAQYKEFLDSEHNSVFFAKNSEVVFISKQEQVDDNNN